MDFKVFPLIFSRIFLGTLNRPKGLYNGLGVVDFLEGC